MPPPPARPPAALDRYRAEVEAELRGCVLEAATAGGPAARLYAMLQYHLGWLDEQLQPAASAAGKRLRPALCLLAAEAVRGERGRALPAAVAVELVHSFSLIHDDIQDWSDERHHRPTVWRLWGEAQGIDVGDATLVLAELTLLRAIERGVEPAVVLAGARLLNTACLRLAEGQHLDISFEGRLAVSLADYLAMIAGKTAALLACSLELGALFASGDAGLARGYGRLGHELGLAFQAQDDVLGIWGQEERTGKPAAADVYQRKMTLPVIHALAAAGPTEREALVAVYGGAGPVAPADAGRAVAVLEWAGGRARCEELAQAQSAAALRELEALAPAEPAATALRELAAFVASRDY